MNWHAREKGWFIGVSFGLGLIVVVLVCVFLNINDRIPADASGLVGSNSGVAVTSSPPIIQSKVTVNLPHQLPQLDFPPSSVEEACDLNEFPPRVGYYSYEADERSSWPNSPFNAQGDLIALESEECWAALEEYASTVNPYLGWGSYHSQEASFAFVVLDNPLSFGRIFADPSRDFHRVQDALSRPECLLEHTETNWELKDSCHAEAFLNYALFNRFCYQNAAMHRARQHYSDNPTPDQDRLIWKEILVDAWVDTKCKEYSSTLELTEEQYPVLVGSLRSLEERSKLETILIELAARLGDNAAALTHPIYPFGHKPRSYDSMPPVYMDKGYQHGRFTELLTSDAWQKFTTKEEPNVDRFLQTFQMLAQVASRKPDPRDELELNWEWVARYLCEPPYYRPPGEGEPEEPVEHPSCQEIVHEIRQSGTTFRPLLDVLDKFEQVALKLEVYE